MSRLSLPPAPARQPRSLRVDEIVEIARRVLDAEGADAVTMRRIAADLGIRAPSLYKHVDGKTTIEVLLAEDALIEMGAALHTAVARPGRRGRVVALAHAYREYGRTHANLYQLVTGPSFPRDALAPGLEDWAGEPFALAAGDAHRAQALWAWTHGMVSLEIDERFTPCSDLDRTWAEGARAFSAGRRGVSGQVNAVARAP